MPLKNIFKFNLYFCFTFFIIAFKCREYSFYFYIIYLDIMKHLLFDPRTSNNLDFWPFVVKHLGPSDLKKLKEHIYVAHIKKHAILKCKNIIKYIYICIIKTKGRNLKIKTPDINSLLFCEIHFQKR